MPLYFVFIPLNLQLCVQSIASNSFIYTLHCIKTPACLLNRSRARTHMHVYIYNNNNNNNDIALYRLCVQADLKQHVECMTLLLCLALVCMDNFYLLEWLVSMLSQRCYNYTSKVSKIKAKGKGVMVPMMRDILRTE